jgi:hypothetical protein
MLKLLIQIEFRYSICVERSFTVFLEQVTDTGLGCWRDLEETPTILTIRGDDIGVHNISAYNRGPMGYRTPNIDRIAREGAIFTDAYGEQSCTLGPDFRGRAARANKPCFIS